MSKAGSIVVSGEGRLYGMVRERGYQGRPDHFRHLISCHRPRRKAEAYRICCGHSTLAARPA
jgi:hypothetical protein